MKRFRLKQFTAGIMLCAALTACQKQDKTQGTVTSNIPENIIKQIHAQGYSTDGIIKTNDGYIVEGDIFLSNEMLNHPVSGPVLRVANTEQYRTTNLITSLPRVITVSCSGLSQAFVTATDSAVARYNARGLRLTFQRVSSGANIDIVGKDLGGVSGGGVILGQSAGFPDANGNPPSPITLNSNPAAFGSNPNVQYLATVIAHEIGHCIGFRHTDYMNRAYSCGGRHYNEGSAGVGAIGIPGTPSKADPNSWMLACISSSQNRPFNPNDVIALNYLYY
jgi:hypothetical protein